jgi:hypothetical protein
VTFAIKIAFEIADIVKAHSHSVRVSAIPLADVNAQLEIPHFGKMARKLGKQTQKLAARLLSRRWLERKKHHVSDHIFRPEWAIGLQLQRR